MLRALRLNPKRTISDVITEAANLFGYDSESKMMVIIVARTDEGVEIRRGGTLYWWRETLRQFPFVARYQVIAVSGLPYNPLH